MKKLLYLPLFFLSLFVYACVTEYEHGGVTEISGIMVIEGTITPGETEIRLSHSVGLSEDLTDDRYITWAEVFIERGDGARLGPGRFYKEGKYLVETGELDPEMEYRLYVKCDGKEYQSDFRKPVVTPPIDSISWIKRGEGQTVYICVNTHDPEDKSNYYRWKYVEHWEVRATYFANGYMEEGKWHQVYNMGTADNIYYCWGQDSSRTIIVGSTDKLSENIVSEKRLVEMEPTSDKLSRLYYIDVEQYQIRKDAYDYLYNLHKNVEQTGGLFASMPTEMRGNITCVNDPASYVIGFIEVSVPQKSDRFISWEEGLYEDPRPFCPLYTAEDQMGELFYADMNAPPNEWSYSYRSCFDCTAKYRATKNKPYFWPTSNL